MRIARSIAQAFDSALIDRVPRDAARPVAPTSSTPGRPWRNWRSEPAEVVAASRAAGKVTVTVSL